MTMRERIGSVGFGMMCMATVGLMVKHVVSPDMVTEAATNAIAVTASVFIGYAAYDSFKQGLTGQRQ